MLEKIIDFSLKNRLLILALTVIAIVGGGISFLHLPIDAVPDITSVQVQILTRTAPIGPVEVERYVTYPIETAMSGLPDVEEIRSVSRFGLSAVTVVFKDSVNVYFARQLINERLPSAKESIPEGFGTPEMGPVTTGLGEVYQFVVSGDGYSPMDLKQILKWQIVPRIKSVPGVTEVSAEGGFEKQYQVKIHPSMLVAYHVSIGDVFKALQENNAVGGGGYIEKGGEAYLIRGEGLVTQKDQIEKIIISHTSNGTPITVANIGEVVVGFPPRIGAATKDGKGEAVIAMALMLKGANAREVAHNVRAEIEKILPTLPPGVKIEPFYDRAQLVDQVIHTVVKNLIEGGILVIVILLLLLGSIRAGLVVSSAIPLSMLFAFTAMYYFGISGNLMSLGAIDFGLIVDGAVITIENSMRHLALRQQQLGRPLDDHERALTVRNSVLEVMRAAFFGQMVIAIVYIPILALTGIEGKMFRPMASTVLFALAAASLLSFTLIPVLASLVLRGHISEKEPFLLRWAHKIFDPGLQWTMKRPKVTSGLAGAVLLVSLVLVPFMGSEFIPRLDEGDIVLNAFRLPSVALSESVKTTLQIEKVLKTFPEVTYVVSRTGTPDVATDVMGMELSDIFVGLKPKKEWKTAKTKAELVEKMQETLARETSGIGFSFSQPIEMRFNELIAGVRSDVAVKIFGPDLKILKEKGDEVVKALSEVKGAEDVKVEQIAGLPVMRVIIDREKIARFGINAHDVIEALEAAVGGKKVGEIFEEERRYDLTIRISSPLGENPSNYEKLPIAGPKGTLIPLGELAKITIEDGPAQVSREKASRRIVVECNVRGRDIGSFIQEAQRKLQEEVKLPSGYFLEWGGQFKNLEQAKQRLIVAVPIALFLIFIILFATFRSVRPALLIYLNIPIAATGGILSLFLRGMPLSISAGVGFIALFGVAVLNGVVLLTSIRRMELEEGLSPQEAALNGARTRLRPVLMTALVASLGFLPMAISTSPGAEVQRPLATVVIGGLVTSTLLTLFVLPTIYGFAKHVGDITGSLRPKSKPS
ncbi:MAG: CusA/CzcA family heavy metal efflux RND transporter [bacterium]